MHLALGVHQVVLGDTGAVGADVSLYFFIVL